MSDDFVNETKAMVDSLFAQTAAGGIAKRAAAHGVTLEDALDHFMHVGLSKGHCSTAEAPKVRALIAEKMGIETTTVCTPAWQLC